MSVGAAAPAPGAPPAVPPEQRVTALELFFDLVFVFAITQVTGFVSAHPDWTRLAEGMAILTMLWWAWGCYAWLGNNAASDDGLFRVALLSAMAAMLVVAIAVPHAFGKDAVAFGAAYCVVRILHIAAYVVLARPDPALRAAVAGLARSMIPVGLLLLTAGLLHGPGRTACWVAAIVIDVGGLWLFGVDGWRVEAGHLAERYSGILIIALGESIVALGVGAEGLPLHAGLIGGVLLGITVAAALWWAYFDVVALVAQRRFSRATGRDRVLIARDSYTYLHLPMVAGIILFALGVKKTLAHISDPLETVPAVGLCGGVALYLVALVAFRLRNVHRLNVARLIAAAALVVLIVPARHADALLTLGLTAAVMVAPLAYERVRYHDLRRRLRRQLT
ncbi:low temperature requirement protein A [Baekduia soli]|uniref:Low temperature requirement protein A n=1 Tax=Baekduia soli TaxID=496014 RepID=A0A5B8U7K6_9ACTN|nr:low temperature requirement protein A [Baekduia soli]QEC49083.1 low temperature requirement protein A [Baekduia soli]